MNTEVTSFEFSSGNKKVANDRTSKKENSSIGLFIDW
jgi:hypothetical protein